MSAYTQGTDHMSAHLTTAIRDLLSPQISNPIASHMHVKGEYVSQPLVQINNCNQAYSLGGQVFNLHKRYCSKHQHSEINQAFEEGWVIWIENIEIKKVIVPLKLFRYWNSY